METDREKAMDDRLNELQHIDTIKLVLLALVTLGIYLAIYIRRQSAVINEIANESGNEITNENGEQPGQPIPEWASLAPQILAVISIFSLVLYLLNPSETMEHIDSATGLLFNISLVIWGFSARRSMHAITSAKPRAKLWFDGFWTLLFSPFYFNYRVNVIFETESLAA